MGCIGSDIASHIHTGRIMPRQQEPVTNFRRCCRGGRRFQPRQQHILADCRTVISSLRCTRALRARPEQTCHWNSCDQSNERHGSSLVNPCEVRGRNRSSMHSRHAVARTEVDESSALAVADAGERRPGLDARSGGWEVTSSDLQQLRIPWRLRCAAALWKHGSNSLGVCARHTLACAHRSSRAPKKMHLAITVSCPALPLF